MNTNNKPGGLHLIDTMPYFYYDEKRRIPVYGTYADTYNSRPLEIEILGSAVYKEKQMRLDQAPKTPPAPLIETKTLTAKPE